MLATTVLGILIAGAFGYGIRTIYKNFKGEPACCDSGSCAGCCEHCKAHKENLSKENFA